MKYIIIDNNLYDSLKNGKLIFRPKLSNLKSNKHKLYRVIRKDSTFYYVTKPVMKKIKHSIRKNKCKNISIKRLKNSRKAEINIHRG